MLVVEHHVLFVISVAERAVCRAVTEYVEHFHRERNHQGLENSLIRAPAVVAASDGAIRRHARLGGMLNFHRRQAA